MTVDKGREEQKGAGTCQPLSKMGYTYIQVAGWLEKEEGEEEE